VKESLFDSSRDFGEQQVERGAYCYHQWLQGILGRKAIVFHYHKSWERRDHWRLNAEHISHEKGCEEKMMVIFQKYLLSDW